MPGVVELVAKPGIHVRVDVAGPQLFRDELGHRTLGAVGAKVDHHRNVRLRARFDRALDRRPLGTGVVRGLDPYDQAFVSHRHVRRRLGFHVGQVLLELVAAHAGADDIEERQDSGFRSIDDAILEIVEAPPARRSCVGNRGDARSQRETVRIQAVVAGVRSAFARSGIRVNVNVDESRRDVESGRIDHFQGVAGVDVRGDGRHFPIRNRDVTHRADVVPGIDDVTALQQEVVLLLRRHLRRRRHDETNRGRWKESQPHDVSLAGSRAFWRSTSR